jgi:hypothetical protein
MKSYVCKMYIKYFSTQLKQTQKNRKRRNRKKKETQTNQRGMREGGPTHVATYSSQPATAAQENSTARWKGQRGQIGHCERANAKLVLRADTRR